MNIKSIIESLLFISSKPINLTTFGKIINADINEIKKALSEIFEERKNSGVVLLENNQEYQFATNSENSEYVQNFFNSELREKLTDATLEVLGIIAYRQPISKTEIEAIRGVNSQYSIRHLLIRGLIEKVANPSDSRSSLYQTTTEFLQHLGITSFKELPEFEKIVEQIKLPENTALQNLPNSNSNIEK